MGGGFGLRKDPGRGITEKANQQIISLADSTQVLFALLGGTGLRPGEASGLWVEDLDLDNLVIHVRRSFWKRPTAILIQRPRPDREIDIDQDLAEVLRKHLAGRRTGLVFQSQEGTPLRGGNIIKRVLNPILDQLGIPREAGRFFTLSGMGESLC